MIRRALFVLTAAAAAALTACATVPKHAGTDPVTVGAWCDDVGAVNCKAMADRCFGGLSGVAEGCRDSFRTTCLAGRASDTPAGRTYDELRRCTDYVASLSCEGLGAAVGSGTLSQLCAVSR
jgi:hypothetical protein